MQSPCVGRGSGEVKAATIADGVALGMGERVMRNASCHRIVIPAKAHPYRRYVVCRVNVQFAVSPSPSGRGVGVRVRAERVTSIVLKTWMSRFDRTLIRLSAPSPGGRRAHIHQCYKTRSNAETCVQKTALDLAEAQHEASRSVERNLLGFAAPTTNQLIVEAGRVPAA